MSNCCASGRVYFPGGLSFVHVRECARTRPPALGRGGVWLVWDLRARRWLQNKAHPEPAHRSLGSPSRERGGA